MNRFQELLDKRKNLTADIFEEEELIEISKTLNEEELNKIDKNLLTYSNSLRLQLISNKLDELIDKLK